MFRFCNLLYCINNVINFFNLHFTRSVKLPDENVFCARLRDHTLGNLLGFPSAKVATYRRNTIGQAKQCFLGGTKRTFLLRGNGAGGWVCVTFALRAFEVIGNFPNGIPLYRMLM